MDDVAWGALTIALTVLGGIYTWWAYRHRGLGPGLRGAALALLPLAALLTNTLQMFTRIVDAVGDWATRLVLSPTVWLGVVVAGIAVLLLSASRLVDRRAGVVPAKKPKQVDRPGKQPGKKKEQELSGTDASTASSSGDDDLADIEALLRKRGIT